MRSLRVLVVTVWYPTPDAPTAHTFVRASARAAATRHEVAVLHLRDVARRTSRKTPSSRSDEGIPVWEVPILTSQKPGVTFVRRVIAGGRAARAIRDRFGPADIIHAHMLEAAAPALVLSRLAARGSRPGRVISEHYSGFAMGNLTTGQLIKARTMFGRFDAVLPVSRALARSLEDANVGGRKMVVPNAYDPALFYPPEDVSNRDGPVRLLAVGRLEDVKGFDVLLRALADLRRLPDDRTWQLRIVGHGGQRRTLEALARDLGIERRVTFRGALPPAGVAQEMRHSDLFVAPSRYETQGAAIVEAAGCGLRVLASDVGGIPEIVEHVEGRLVPAGDVASWAAALGEEIVRAGTRDVDARHRQAARARDRWSLSSVGATLDGIYRSILHT